jgi:hypothetical protein
MLLGCAASAAAAQEPLQLRISPAVGQILHYRTDVDAWLNTQLLPQGDPALPTFRIALYTNRTATHPDSGMIIFTDVTDSSRFEMPRIRDVQPQLAPAGDYMRGMRTETLVDRRGRSVSTRVLTAPAMPQDLPVLIRGMQSLALTGQRLSTFSFPAFPIRPGDTWTDSVRYDLGADQSIAPALVTGGGAGLATFRFERIEQRGAVQVAVLTAAGRVSAGAQDVALSSTLIVSASAQMDVDVATGLVLRSQMDMQGPMATRLGTIPVRIRLVMQAR